MQVIQTQTAQPQGIYKPTAIDVGKATVDFCLVAAYSRFNQIRWSDGRLQQVTDKQLSKLQASHKWATDF